MTKDIFEQAEEIIDWSVIENYEKEDTIASWSMALAELAKLLNYLLEDQGYLGHSLEEKIKKAKVRFTDLKGLKASLSIYEKVFKEYGETVTLLDLKEAVKNLKKAVKDLTAESDFSPPTLLERIKTNFDYFCSDKERFYRSGLFFLSFLIILFVLDNTHFGQNFIAILASFFYSILSWLILAGIIIGAVLILALGTIFFLGRGK
ncbi:hypothetical protein J7K05_00195 [bacterium]|nr:hypothetical protein [bacterium]